MNPEPNRRSFLSFVIFGFGTIFTAILGFPVVCYFIDPRHRKGVLSILKLVEGVKVDELGATPVQGVIRDTRVDGWNLYPNDVIGRVWVVKIVNAPTPDFSTPEKIAAFNQNAAAKALFLKVFTTICPHLGCSVNLNGANNGFACPCHSATYLFDGSKANAQNPAKRGMDELEWEIDVDDPKRIKAKYQQFQTLEVRKIPVGGGADQPKS